MSNMVMMTILPMMTISTMMTILTIMTISTMMTIVIERKLEVVHKQVGGFLISLSQSLTNVGIELLGQLMKKRRRKYFSFHDFGVNFSQ